MSCSCENCRRPGVIRLSSCRWARSFSSWTLIERGDSATHYSAKRTASSQSTFPASSKRPPSFLAHCAGSLGPVACCPLSGSPNDRCQVGMSSSARIIAGFRAEVERRIHTQRRPFAPASLSGGGALKLSSVMSRKVWSQFAASIEASCGPVCDQGRGRGVTGDR